MASQEVSLYRAFRWTGIRGERDAFTRDMPLSAELDVSDPVDATEGQDAEDKRHKLIKDANTVLLDTALNWKAADTDARLTFLRAQAAVLRREERLARQVQHARRGTPLGRGAKKNAAEAARKAADIDIEVNRNSYKLMRKLPWVGQGLGIGKDVYDVTTGKEPVGKVAVKNAAGLAGGAAAVVLVANPVGLGVLGTAAVGAGGAYLLSEGASWAWEKGHIQSASKGAAKGAKKAWKWAFG